VQPWLTPVELRSNTLLHEPGDTIEQVYFPVSGMISFTPFILSVGFAAGFCNRRT
jgi:hypothetical protein